MKSEKHSPEETEIKYPYLIHNTLGTVAIINKKGEATILFQGNESVTVGARIYFPQGLGSWKKFTGTITLRGDE